MQVRSLNEILSLGGVVVTTSHPLAPEEKKLVITSVAKRGLGEGTIVYRVDPGVLGGIKIQGSDWYADFTVISQIKDLARKLKS